LRKTMGESEIPVFFLSIIVSLVMFFKTSTGNLHPLFVDKNPAIGLTRFSIILSILWVVIVLNTYADPSITGIYTWFYLILGYAIAKTFGQQAVILLGANFRALVYERKNFAMALVISAFTLGTSLIYGGSLWGEADPYGDDEGGWWIVLAFFILGWLSLVLTVWLYIWRESKAFLANIRQDCDIDSALTFSTYILSTAIVLTEAVAGDFHGWTQGLLSFFTIAGMLVIHEVFHSADKHPQSSPRSKRDRVLEGILYILMAVSSWFISRLLDAFLWGN